MVFHRAGVTVAVALVLVQYVAEGAHTPCRVEKSKNLFIPEAREVHDGLV